MWLSSTGLGLYVGNPEFDTWHQKKKKTQKEEKILCGIYMDFSNYQYIEK
jgi:hypothetical protein